MSGARNLPVPPTTMSPDGRPSAAVLYPFATGEHVLIA